MATITMDDLVTVIPERIKGESETITGQIVAGKRLKVETTPAGEEIVNALVPAGKVCNYKVVVAVELVDA